MHSVISPTYRIGVDVGGTNTDAVVLALSPEAATSPDRGVKASFKTPTTPDVTSGIEECVRTVLTNSKVRPDQVSALMIGTTHFINAVVQADPTRLSRVAVLRLGAPYTLECPSFIDFPPSLRAIMEGYTAVINGGLQIDGTEIGKVDEEELRRECVKIKELGLHTVVIVGIYSPLDKGGSSQEEHVRKVILKEMGGNVDVVCSRDVGQVGLLERENASILNASILRFARRTVRSFQVAMSRLGLGQCPLYLTQNDGTLTSAASAARLPIRTFASGATNSMRGASYLAGLGAGPRLSNAAVGGTTTDVGVLLPSGFPRQAAAFIEVGGVRTNFAMPDVQSIGLGGGSRVRFQKDENGKLAKAVVGPDSVGYKLLSEGLVFGGTTPTATDIFVASSAASTAPSSEKIGDPSKVEGRFAADELREAQKAMKKLMEGIIDRMKTSPEPATVLLVGGGSVIAPDELEGVGELIRPPFFACANAVGAAVGSVSGEVDTIKILQNRSLDEVVESLKTEAILKAQKAGAKKETIKVVEVENLPVQYVTNKATRLIVRAVGELDNEVFAASTESAEAQKAGPIGDGSEDDESTPETSFSRPVPVAPEVDIAAYRPNVTSEGVWELSEIDLEWISEGCGILGTGGGGSPYPPYLMAREILRQGGSIRVLDASALPDDAIVLRGHFMGSPSVSNERLQSGYEVETAARNLSKYLGIAKGAAIISDEIGGGNGIQPMILASQKHLDVPVFDGDLMGRAYPNMHQSLPAAYDVKDSLTPCAIADGVNNSVASRMVANTDLILSETALTMSRLTIVDQVLPSTSTKWHVEAILRGVCTTLGSKAGVSMAPLTAKVCRDFGVTRTVSQAWRMGRAVAECRKRNDVKGIPAAILELQNGACIFIGKIVDVQREVRAGFTWGSVRIASLAEDEQEIAPTATVAKNGHDEATENAEMTISFQNENLVATLEMADGRKKAVAVVPDLITVLDSQSGTALGTHEYRYGLRITVMALAGDPKWTTPEGLACGGPAAFGLTDVEWVPVGEYKEPRSVIEEFKQ